MNATRINPNSLRSATARAIRIAAQSRSHATRRQASIRISQGRRGLELRDRTFTNEPMGSVRKILQVAAINTMAGLTCFVVTAAASTATGQCDRWFLVHVAAPQGPSVNQSLVFQPTLNTTLLYDGLLGPSGRQTWMWDGSSWLQVAGQQPDSEGSHSAVFDQRLNRVLLFGGQRLGSCLMTRGCSMALSGND